MKKFVALLLVLTMVLAFAGCGNTTPTTKPQGTTGKPTAPTTTVKPTEKPTEPQFDPSVKSEGVMTYGEFAAAAMDTQVVIETFVQAKQGWWENNGVGVATFYTQDTEGGYFLYNMPCSKEDFDKMVPGTHIRVTGWKAEYAGEVEIIDATYEILEDGTYVAEPMDITGMLNAANLADYMNLFVAINGATVVAANDNGDAFMYKWNGSGSEGDDLYFKVSVAGTTYTFCVESYLCGVGSDAYEGVRALKVGDTINLEGFLYWYNGLQPHITSVKVVAGGFDPAAKSEGVMTYAQFAGAAMDTEVIVETFVQAKQGWWENNGVGVATFYTQDTEGGYFLYNMPCSKEDYDKMTIGTHIRVTGWKAEYAGEVEIIDATFEILNDGTYVAKAMDVTALLGADNLADYMNLFVAIKGATVVACNGNGDAFMYKWNGSGSEGDDLYFKVSVAGVEYTFCVESYLCGVGTEAYEGVRALKVGDVIDLEGFLYWYNGAQPHITAVKAAA